MCMWLSLMLHEPYLRVFVLCLISKPLDSMQPKSVYNRQLTTGMFCVGVVLCCASSLHPQVIKRFHRNQKDVRMAGVNKVHSAKLSGLLWLANFGYHACTVASQDSSPVWPGQISGTWCIEAVKWPPISVPITCGLEGYHFHVLI